MINFDVGMHRASSCLRASSLRSVIYSALPRQSRRPQRDRLVPRAYSASARDKDKEQLLRGVSVECREDVARILDQAQRADATWDTITTDFYTPPVIADAVAVIKKMPEIACKAWGGYPQAERTRLVIAKAEMLADEPQVLPATVIGPVACRD